MSYDFSAGVNRGIDYSTTIPIANPTTGAFSWGCWMRATNVATTFYCLNVNGSSGIRFVTLLVSDVGGVGSGQIIQQVFFGTNDILVQRSTATVAANTWTHIGAYWNGSSGATAITLYKNGAIVNSSATNLPTTVNGVANARGPWRVSGRSQDSTLGIPGTITLPFFYQRQLTSDEWNRLGGAEAMDPRHLTDSLKFAPRLINAPHDWVTNNPGTLANAPTVSSLIPSPWSPIIPSDLMT